MTLRDYARKRRFTDTPEPADDAGARRRGRGAHRPIFVVQLHNARARHYDFRLEADGALKSWAVPKGPSLRAGEKRLAVQVEDHPLSYAGFQGAIPEGNYGAGHVLVFDHGVWACDGDPLAGIAAGKLDFTLEGGKLRGAWKLIRTGQRRTNARGDRDTGKPQWLLVKRDDAHARDAEADDLVEVEPGAESSAEAARVWMSGESEREKASVSRRTRKEEPSPDPIRTDRKGRKTARGNEASVSAAMTASKRIATRPAAHDESKPRARRNDAAWRKRALALPGATDKPLPPGFKPELATLRPHAPEGDVWLHEVKWDGYRLLADLIDGRAKLRSRNGLDWTGDFPALAAAIEALPVADARLDGELVALDAAGNSDFALLQRVLQGTSNTPLRYLVFDLPGMAGVDLSRTPLLARKTLLRALLDRRDPALVYSDHVLGHGGEVFAASAAQALEGIVSKRVDAPYTQSRSAYWIKTKHAQGDEFVIVGYSAPKGARTGFGALLLAAADGNGLRYVGRVGTGYTDSVLKSLHARLKKLERSGAAVELPDHLPYDKRDRGDIHWVEPELIAEVAYRGWGKDGLLRQASFQRLRTDKTVEDLRVPASEHKDTSGKRVGAAVVHAPPRGKTATAAKKRAAKPAAARQATSKKTSARERAADTSHTIKARESTSASKVSSPQHEPGRKLTSSARSEDQDGSRLSPGRREQGAPTTPKASRSPQVQISSRDRVVFKSAGITKGQVADYYAAVAEHLLPGIADRPLSLLRCPRGAAAECFFQKHHAESLGAHVRVVPIDTASGTDDYLTVRDAVGLLELVQMNALEFHPWGAKIDRPERPDTLVFDLDPGPDVGWKDVVAAARDVRARLQDAALDSFVRLSGGKGVHVVVPIRRGPTWDQAKDFSGAFAEAMAAHRPLQYVATMSKAKRTGRIFIDWLRNGRGATSVCSWSLRARDGAPVAMPIRWEELGRVPGPDAFDLHKALKRAKTLKADPWEGYAALKQSLPKLD